MVMNMVRGLIVNIVIAWLLCWIVLRMNHRFFGSVLTAALVVGIIVFLNSAYTMHIWYQSFDLMAHFADAIVSWGLAGLWLGWWLTKTSRRVELSNKSVSNVERLNT